MRDCVCKLCSAHARLFSVFFCFFCESSLFRINQRHHSLRTRLWHTPPAVILIGERYKEGSRGYVYHKHSIQTRLPSLNFPLVKLRPLKLSLSYQPARRSRSTASAAASPLAMAPLSVGVEVWSPHTKTPSPSRLGRSKSAPSSGACSGCA